MGIRRKAAIEGVILERFDDEGTGYVSATLLDSGNYSYYAEIDLDRFEQIDQAHCIPGALFTISAGSELKVRRKTVSREG